MTRYVKIINTDSYEEEKSQEWELAWIDKDGSTNTLQLMPQDAAKVIEVLSVALKLIGGSRCLLQAPINYSLER